MSEAAQGWACVQRRTYRSEVVEWVEEDAPLARRVLGRHLDAAAHLRTARSNALVTEGLDLFTSQSPCELSVMEWWGTSGTVGTRKAE